VYAVKLLRLLLFGLGIYFVVDELRRPAAERRWLPQLEAFGRDAVSVYRDRLDDRL
jgi:hypothetical protein